MGENFKIILFLLFIPLTLRKILAWLYWIQVKEYRIDRFKVLVDSQEGKKVLYIYSWFIEIFLIFIACFLPLFRYLTLGFLVYQVLLIILDFLNQRIRKPVFTQRICLIFLTTFIFFLFSFAIYFSYWNNIFLLFFFWELSSFMSIVVGVLWTILIVNRVKKDDITKARQKLSIVKPLVIGITGSYGKTSTKEFLNSLLSSQAKTACTIANENTEFGIARMIINRLKKGTKYLVIEMGAYKKGEIAAICKIVEPKVGVITGIEPQHLALFGNLETIKDTKFELIESLPKKGLAFFNYSNKYCQELAQRAKQLSSKLQVFGYCLNGFRLGEKKPDCTAQIINQTDEGVEFKLNIGNERAKILSPLKGKHFVENLAGAILIARKLKVPLSKIKNSCLALQALPGTMSVYRLKKGDGCLIDDSYNTTPKGFEAALEYLQIFTGFRKIVLTPGIIELGEDSKRIHFKIGRLLRRTDQILLTNNEFEKDIKKGLGSKSYKLETISNVKKLGITMKKLITYKKLALLIEGRIPADMQKLIGNYKK